MASAATLREQGIRAVVAPAWQAAGGPDAGDERASGAQRVGPALAPSDLAALFSQFNDMTARLQATHETLSGEVTRLKAELLTANEQLRRSRELAALGEMAAGIAHEVRNPLGSIKLYASMLEQDLGDRPDQRRVATKIGEAVRGLDHIVGDVLSFAREMKIRGSRVGAWELLERAADACGPELKGMGVELQMATAVREAGDAGGMELTCDAGLIHQALLNIIRNAAEAIGEGGARVSEGGVVTLSVARRGARREGGRAERMAALVVRDNGPGISEDVKKRMFNPFFTTRAAGAGLGLAIVHRIMDAHAGQIKVSNHARGGAVVELLLPLDAPAQNQQVTPELQGGGA